MSIIMGLGALLLILAILGRKLWLNGQYHGLTEGLLQGYDHGDRDGYARGYSQAALDHVLATPTLCEHNDQMLRMVGAEDSAQSWDAVRMGGVRRSVQGQEGLS